MNVKEIPELNVINDIVISHLIESRDDYLERKKKLKFESDIGLSSVMDSPLVHYLRQTNPDVQSLTSDHLDTMIGEFMHKELQRHFIAIKGTSCYIEEPVQIKAKGELGEWSLSGRIDILEMLDQQTVKIGDIKVTSAFQVQTINKELYKYEQSGDWRELKHKYIYQLNAYAEGMRQLGKDVKELYLMIYCKHWTKRLAWEDQNFPQFPMFYRKIPLLSSEQIQEYLTECVNRHQAAEMGLQEDILPRCNQDDLWLSDHKEWAVKVKGKKKAIKLFTKRSEAQDLANRTHEGFVEHRPLGLSIRCRDYCLYNEVCPQYNKQKQGAENATK